MMILNLLESSLNQTLKLDPQAKTQLAKFQDKILKLNIEGLPFPIFVILTKEQIFLQETCLKEPDLCLTAPPASFIDLALTQDKTAALRSPYLHIEGDMNFAQALQIWMEAFHLDWAAFLSPIIGPTLSGLFEQASSRLHAFRHTVLERFSENLTEYLQEEKQIFPSRQEVEDFYHEVDELRDRLERVAKKIEALDA